MRIAKILFVALGLWPAMSHACPACAGIAGDGYGIATVLMLGMAILLPVGMSAWFVYADERCHSYHREQVRDD